MPNTRIREGIILIFDFSDVIKSVSGTRFHKSKYLKELLSMLMEANNGCFYLSEIKGHTIVFYKYKKQPFYRSVVPVLQKMQAALSKKIREQHETHNVPIRLAAKIIVHYGGFSRYNIKSDKKVCGKAVEEAYRMSKGGYLPDSSYILFTNSFLEALEDYHYNISENKADIPEAGTMYFFDT